MPVKLPLEPKPLEEIEAMFPDHWILIDQPVLDAGKRLVSGVVVFTAAEKMAVHEQISALKLTRFAIHRTKKDPPDRRYL